MCWWHATPVNTLIKRHIKKHALRHCISGVRCFFIKNKVHSRFKSINSRTFIDSVTEVFQLFSSSGPTVRSWLHVIYVLQWIPSEREGSIPWLNILHSLVSLPVLILTHFLLLEISTSPICLFVSECLHSMNSVHTSNCEIVEPPRRSIREQ